MAIESRLLLSSIAHQEIFVNSKGYAWIKLNEKDSKTGRNKEIVRKVTSKYFSNWSVDTVRINNKVYLIDTLVTVSDTASAQFERRWPVN